MKKVYKPPMALAIISLLAVGCEKQVPTEVERIQESSVLEALTTEPANGPTTVVSQGTGTLGPLASTNSSSGQIYSHQFVGGTSYFTGSPQYDDWLSYRASLSMSGVTSITISGSRDLVGRTCSDAAKAQQIADAMRAGASSNILTFTVFCDGFNWNVAGCSQIPSDPNNLELNATPRIEFCRCNNDAHVVRPGITGGSVTNAGWGGVGGTNACGPPTQTLTVTVEADPTDKDECKKGGGEAFEFRNQGQCIRFVNTGKDSRES